MRFRDGSDVGCDDQPLENREEPNQKNPLRASVAWKCQHPTKGGTPTSYN